MKRRLLNELNEFSERKREICLTQRREELCPQMAQMNTDEEGGSAGGSKSEQSV